MFMQLCGPNVPAWGIPSPLTLTTSLLPYSGMVFPSLRSALSLEMSHSVFKGSLFSFLGDASLSGTFMALRMVGLIGIIS